MHYLVINTLLNIVCVFGYWSSPTFCSKSLVPLQPYVSDFSRASALICGEGLPNITIPLIFMLISLLGLPYKLRSLEHAQATHSSTYWSPALHTTEFCSDSYKTIPIVTCSSHLQAIPASLDKSISLVRMPAVEKV